jgi:hypothetical protein
MEELTVSKLIAAQLPQCHQEKKHKLEVGEDWTKGANIASLKKITFILHSTKKYH